MRWASSPAGSSVDSRCRRADRRRSTITTATSAQRITAGGDQDHCQRRTARCVVAGSQPLRRRLLIWLGQPCPAGVGADENDWPRRGCASCFRHRHAFHPRRRGLRRRRGPVGSVGLRRRVRPRARRSTHRRPRPSSSARRTGAGADHQRRHGHRLERRGRRRPRPPGCRSPRSRAASIIRAGSTCCPTATCSSPRPTRRRGPRTTTACTAGSSSGTRRRPAARVPSANRITLLRDADGDGVAEARTVLLDGSATRRSAWRSSATTLYVANTDAVVRFPTRAATRRSTARRPRSLDLPAGPRNHHWTKNIIASPDGTQALRRGRLEQQRRRERHGRGSRAARRSGRSISRPARTACSPRACAIRSAWPGSPRPARCGWRSTSATSSATISCPTT